MRNEKISFKPRARLMAQLGDQLIKNESIAMLELVKNCYDADAKEVKVRMFNIDEPDLGEISIEDDGNGMTYDTVRNVWMEPGTENKKNILTKMITNKEKSPLNRLPLGEKGIGRFGVHKLGHKIQLITRAFNSLEVFLEIDWTVFESNDYLEDVPIRIIERTPEIFTGEKTGTYIQITNLKASWTRGMLRDVYRSINSLNSPFDTLDKFTVSIDTNKQNWLEKLLKFEEISNNALYRVDMELSGNMLLDYKYNFTPWPVLSKLSPREHHRTNIELVTKKRVENDDGKKKTVLVPINLSQLGIGTVKIKLLIFDLDSSILKLGFTDVDGIRKYLDKNGGIALYRDKVRVENDNDWLGLESRRINDPTRGLSYKLVIGAVYLDRDSSIGLEEKTNREGLIQNNAFNTLRDAVMCALYKVEVDRKIDKDLLRKYYGPNSKSEPVVSSIAELREKVDKKIKDEVLQKEFSSCLDNIENDYKYINEVYLKSASAGLSLSIVIHEIEKIIFELKRAIKSETASLHIKTLINHLEKVTNSYAEIIRNKKRNESDLIEIINEAIFSTKYRLLVHDIEIVDGYSAFEDNCTIKCTESLIISTLINLMDNSIWWMEYTHIKNKKIYLGISNEMPGYKSIIIADNGMGFTLPTEQIIKPFITDKPDGIGLGLYLASEIMDSNKGKLIFPPQGDFTIPKEFENGAIIVLAFKEDDK